MLWLTIKQLSVTTLAGTNDLPQQHGTNQALVDSGCVIDTLIPVRFILGPGNGTYAVIYHADNTVLLRITLTEHNPPRTPVTDVLMKKTEARVLQKGYSITSLRQ